jgi:hypothetical protein
MKAASAGFIFKGNVISLLSTAAAAAAATAATARLDEAIKVLSSHPSQQTAATTLHVFAAVQCRL